MSRGLETVCPIDVLLVIEAEIATTQLVERVLLACSPFNVCYRKVLVQDLEISHFREHTIPLFVRCAEPFLRYWLDLLASSRHPYIYYLDDNFWKITGSSPLALYYRNPLVRRTLEFAVSGASLVLTNADELAKYLAAHNSHVSVVPALFDFSLIEGCVKESTDEIRIGFAGSSSRVEDLEILAPLIPRVLDEFPRGVFEFAGVMPHGLVESDRIRFFPHTSSYGDFIRFQAERSWAIGLAPLRDTESNRCKTDNKYREYGACRIPGIYSDIPPYKGSVVSGETGLLSENSGEAWLKAIRRMILDHELRQSIAEKAYSDVRGRYCVDVVSERWVSCFSTVDLLLRQNPPLSLKAGYVAFLVKYNVGRLEDYAIRFVVAFKQGGLKLVFYKLFNRLRRRGLD